MTSSGSTTARGEGERYLLAFCACGVRFVGLPGEPMKDRGVCDLCGRAIPPPIALTPAAPAQQRIEELEGALERIANGDVPYGATRPGPVAFKTFARSALSPKGES